MTYDAFQGLTTNRMESKVKMLLMWVRVRRTNFEKCEVINATATDCVFVILAERRAGQLLTENASCPTL